MRHVAARFAVAVAVSAISGKKYKKNHFCCNLAETSTATAKRTSRQLTVLSSHPKIVREHHKLISRQSKLNKLSN